VSFSSASSVLQIPVGILGERCGEALILLLGNIWVGLGLVLMAASGGYALLLLSALIAGIEKHDVTNRRMQVGVLPFRPVQARRQSRPDALRGAAMSRTRVGDDVTLTRLTDHDPADLA